MRVEGGRLTKGRPGTEAAPRTHAQVHGKARFREHDLFAVMQASQSGWSVKHCEVHTGAGAEGSLDGLAPITHDARLREGGTGVPPSRQEVTGSGRWS